MAGLQSRDRGRHACRRLPIRGSGRAARDAGACAVSLPSGFLDDLRSRVSLSQVAGRKVTWDARKSKRAKGDMWAPCPFHQEKTASFHVDDRKGFYYCFGCHAKGNVFRFVQDTENVTFMEAVRILAREAGMQVPEPDPEARQGADRRARLAEVMEEAVRHYRLKLRSGAAAAARDYLSGRGLSGEALSRWEVGFAPAESRNLLAHLTGKGAGADLVVDAGLAVRPDDGSAPYDRFRGRIIFPIRDPRGVAVALAGRAMDPKASAKYLNSPETELFDKGRCLYNHGPARKAAGKAPLIVAEGYMDVIALSEAGFAATVAPMGTAVTETQLKLIWQMESEPVIALDGDDAGFRAAVRVAEMSLPLLEAGKSLRFCMMPEGMDPDDLVRSGGAAAMRRQVEGSLSLLHLLWRRETEGRSFDSPERRAALDGRLRAAVGLIRDPSLRRHCNDEIFHLMRALSAGRRGAPRAGLRSGAAGPMAATRASALVSADALAHEHLKEAVILASLVTHPGLVPRFSADLERLDTIRPEHEAVRKALLAAGESGREAVAANCGPQALEKLFRSRHVRIAPAMQPGADEAFAALAVAKEFENLAAKRGAHRDIQEAMKDIEGQADESLTYRLGEAAQTLAGSDLAAGEDETEYDVGTNGARMSRRERSAFDALVAGLDYEKPRSRT